MDPSHYVDFATRLAKLETEEKHRQKVAQIEKMARMATASTVPGDIILTCRTHAKQGRTS